MIKELNSHVTLTLFYELRLRTVMIIVRSITIKCLRRDKVVKVYIDKFTLLSVKF